MPVPSSGRAPTPAPRSIWDFPYASHRRTIFYNFHSGKALEIADGSRANGARAQQWAVPYVVPNHMVWDF